MGIFDYLAEKWMPKQTARDGIYKTLNELADKLTDHEIEIRQAQKEWENTFHSVTDAIVLINPDMSIRRGNRAFCKLTNSLPSEIAGRQCYEVTGCDKTMCIAEKLFRTPCSSENEIEAVVPYRGYTLNIKYVPVCHVNGELDYVVSTARDITEKHKAQQELKAQMKRNEFLYLTMRALCDNIPVMVWSKDKESRITFSNKAHAEFLGAKDTNEPIGLTDMFFASRERDKHPNDENWWTFGELCIDSDAETLRLMKPCQFFEAGNIQGKFRYLDVRKAPFYGADGVLQGTVGCGVDMTEMQAMMHILFSERGRIRKVLDQNYITNLLDSSPILIWLKDTAGKFMWVSKNHQKINKRWEQTIGYTADEYKAAHPEFHCDLPTINAEDARALSGEIVIVDTERDTVDGERILFRTARFPVRDVNGQIVGIGGIHFDKKLYGFKE